MKTLTSFFIFLFTAFFLFSCSTGGSGISELEIAGSKDGTIAIGQTHLVSATIRTERPLEEVRISIKPTSGEGWQLDEVFNQYLGDEENTISFAESIAIPTDAKAAPYVLTLNAVQEGGDVLEQSMDVKLAIDNTIPIASSLDVGINAAGNDLHLESELTAVKKIKQVTVKVVGESWSKDFVFDSPKIKDQLSYVFHEHVHVDDAPKGAYQVILVLQDQEGREGVAEGNFTKK